MFVVLSEFAKDEAGAVTVDWVVLTGAIVGLGIGVIQTVEGGVLSLGDNISSTLAGMTVGDRSLHQSQSSGGTDEPSGEDAPIVEGERFLQ